MAGHTTDGAARSLAAATRCVALGRPEPGPGAPVNPPITLSSTFLHDGAREAEFAYVREDTPAWRPFEEALGGLEGGRALAFGSGMAAAAAAISLVPVGGVVVAPRSAYMGVLSLLRDGAAAGLYTVREVDPTDTAAVVAALPGADLVWLESPSNPLLDVADLPALLTASREQGVTSVVDNTFSTPLLSRPLELGADIVMHSATKYLAGHSDVLLGALVTASPGENAGVREGAHDGAGLHERLAHHRHLHGAAPGALETWLALRGLRTLAVRFERACANAADLAGRLQGHPAVERVRYPGQGAMLAIEVRGGAAAAESVCATTTLWAHATSLGGVESLIERRRRYDVVPDSLVRLSVGIEDVDDLWADLEAALDRLASLGASDAPGGLPAPDERT
ncbi:trans-sulfuration enzyme family protein [Piscicoccus intestinalis]|uniref:trans-sulfuration enzyme family protein n=1 Tax=Piscicoccus intestinalis TaxID=746033 RepID=UPI000838463C|nr:PLP-dependent transferase [Piscicoccus intestinalis]